MFLYQLSYLLTSVKAERIDKQICNMKSLSPYFHQINVFPLFSLDSSLDDDNYIFDFQLLNAEHPTCTANCKFSHFPDTEFFLCRLAS